MNFWFSFWVWVGLIVASIAVFALLLKSLLNRALEAGHQLARLGEKFEALASVINQKPDVATKSSSIEADPRAVTAERQRLLRERLKLKRARQRRLIASLKKFDPNESRFR